MYALTQKLNVVEYDKSSISKDVLDKSEQSHYFIKFDEKISDELYSQLSTIQFDCKNNTVGPKSISKQELIKEINMLICI